MVDQRFESYWGGATCKRSSRCQFALWFPGLPVYYQVPSGRQGWVQVLHLGRLRPELYASEELKAPSFGHSGESQRCPEVVSKVKFPPCFPCSIETNDVAELLLARLEASAEQQVVTLSGSVF